MADGRAPAFSVMLRRSMCAAMKIDREYQPRPTDAASYVTGRPAGETGGSSDRARYAPPRHMAGGEPWTATALSAAAFAVSVGLVLGAFWRAFAG